MATLRKRLSTILVAVFIFGMTMPAAFGQSVPSLDSGFGTGGVATYDSGSSDSSEAVVVDGSENVYVAGFAGLSPNRDILVTKFLPNGTLDATFGVGGTVTYDGGSGDDSGKGLALDGSGNLYVAGGTNNGSDADLIVLKYLPNGTLDATFGVGGAAIYDGGANDFGYSLVLDSSDNVYVAGFSHNGSDEDVLVVKFLPNGTPDATFGTGGVAVYDGGDRDYGHGVAVDASGAVYVSGNSYNGSDYDLILMKFLSDGTLDGTFAAGGIATYNGGAYDEGYGVVLDSSGNIFVSGASHNTTDDLIIEKYLSDGTLDVTFGVGGTATYDGGDDDYGYYLVLGSDGHPIIAGERYDSIASLNKLILVSFNKDTGALIWNLDYADSDGSGGNMVAVTMDTVADIIFVADWYGSDFIVAKFSEAAAAASAPTQKNVHGRCYMATAAYGSPEAPAVRTLTGFRDRYLMTHPVGRTFVEWYANVAPVPAHAIAETDGLRDLTKGFLTPLIAVVSRPAIPLAFVLVLMALLVHRLAKSKG